MAKYEARCRVCGVIIDYDRPVSRCLDTPVHCGQPALKVILSAPQGFVRGRFDTFKSMVDGSLIRTQRELEEHNKRNNVVSLADGYTDDVIAKGEYVKPPPKDPAKQEVIDAYHMVKQGYKPERINESELVP